ncbi:uncharacterized protein LOC134656418 [Cydia amplana]|uniref:uncharacterized protein LOC134656418 n=1 Tax=Cydia amplana TaxID=1869771 RepID=UPI002FE6534A
MSQSCQIVPWFDSKEWFEVYEKIYSAPSLKTKQEALEILLVWKARCPSLPAGIESTLGLLEVHIQDSTQGNEKLLRLAYATAMMRFVNHMLDAEIAKGTSLHQAARVSDVPDWIIDLRHDTAHNNVLPSIEILREASLIGLEWLNNNYWSKHREYIKDFVSGHKEINSTDENKISVLINFCTTLSICASPSCKIKNVSDIADNNMKEAIINDARDLFTNSMDFSNLKTVSIASLVNTLNINAKRLLKSKNTPALVNKALTSEDSLFLSSDLLHYLCETDFYVKSKLSFQYVQCFEVLLTFLQTNDLLMDLVQDLIKFTNEENDSEKRKLAALWVSEILQALKKSVLFSHKINGSDPDQTRNKKSKELKLLYKHWFPNEKQSGLLLDLHKGVPSEWMDIKFIQPIISAYNPYLIYFIKPLLDLVEPGVPKINIDKICNLAKIISTPESGPAHSTKVYTIEDLQSGQTSRVVAQDPDSDCMEICEEEILDNTTVCEEEFQTGIWQRASSNYNWSLCPVGILPWQIRVNQ